MTKRQLIDEIRTLNETADPAFLARFEDGDLDEYLRHLRWRGRPSSREPWSRANRSLRPAQAEPEEAPAATATAVAPAPEPPDEGVTASERSGLLAPTSPAAKARTPQGFSFDAAPRERRPAAPVQWAEWTGTAEQVQAQAGPTDDALDLNDPPRDELYGPAGVGYVADEQADAPAEPDTDRFAAEADTDRFAAETDENDAPEMAATPSAAASEADADARDSQAPEPATVASSTDDAAPFADDQDEESWLF